MQSELRAMPDGQRRAPLPLGQERDLGLELVPRFYETGLVARRV
jgi:hypothetical protein